MRINFDQAIDQTLGPAAPTTNFPEQDLTPENEYHEGSANSIDPDHGDLEVTPETGDNFIGAEIMIPRGGMLLRGRVLEESGIARGTLLGDPTQTQRWTHDPTLWSSTIMTRLN